MNARLSSLFGLPRPRGLACCGAVVLTGFILLGCARTLSSAATVRWDLTPEAELSYATLLLDQSIRHDDKEGVLEAVDIFARRDPRPQAFLDAAAWLLLNKHGDEARELLVRGVALNPDNLEIHLLLAESWLEDRDPVQAVEVMQAFRKSHPRSELAKQELGILYVKIGRYGDGDKLLSSLPERLRNAFVRYCHARALAALDRPDEAIGQLRLAVKESPEFTDAWFELARILQARHQTAEAARIYARVLELDPGNQEIWLRLVEMELKANHPAKALDYVKSGPESFGFRLGAVTLFLDAGRFQEAKSQLLSISAEADAPEEVYFYLAAVAYEGDRDQAATLAYLDKITAANRFYDRALRLRAQILYGNGRADEALAVVRDGERIFPADRELRLMEAHLLLSAERQAEALAVADKALEEWPGDRELLFLRGSVLDMLDRKAEALAVMESILRTAPDDYQALNYIGYTLAEANRELDRALALLRKAVQLAPDQAYILDSLAWAQFRKGLAREALESIRRAVKLPGGDEAAIWDHYGDIASAQGRHDEARRAWNKALTLDPDDPQAIRDKLGTR